MKAWWRQHPTLDLVGALLALLGLIAKSTAVAALVPTVAAVLAIFGAVVAFACGTLYQSRAPSIQDVRVRFGRELRRTWRWCLTTTVWTALAAAITTILPAKLAVMACLGVAGIGFLAVLRAISWVSWALRKEDEAIPGVERGVDSRPKIVA